ncbi:MAG: dTMP kinase [Balneolaceae bacterium]|nr:MAG: dTMP kinase [Balneolaceae bacterium]
MIISFEGIDGCGKSTQIQLLIQYFTARGETCVTLREPGGTEISEKIRSLLLHETDEMNSVTELLLFSAARSQLITEKIQPLQQSGTVIILDRFFDSTTAYQGYGRESAAIEAIEFLNRLATHHTEPDLTFYLKIDPEKAAARNTSQNYDRIEKEGVGFFKKVTEGYDQLAELHKRIHTVDASLTPEQIHLLVTGIISDFRQS